VGFYFLWTNNLFLLTDRESKIGNWRTRRETNKNVGGSISGSNHEKIE
jgi:hypothetical protein